MSAVVDVLRKAKERLETYGWRKGAFIDTAGLCCAVGAVRKVTERYPYSLTDLDVRESALKVLDSVLEGRTIVGFNDSPHTTKEDVLALFDKAIEAASKQETSDAR